MSALVASKRYNWMGHHGTETEVVDTALLRSDPNSRNANEDYEHRQQIIADIKERLHCIKRDLNLIPEDELRAEQELRERRKQARKEREIAAIREREEEARRKAEEEERRRVEEEEREEEAKLRQAQEEERKRDEEAAARENAARWRQMHDSDEDSEDEDERNAILEKMPRSQEEIDAGVKGFTSGTRALLAARGTGYVSYLDGSIHSSPAVLEAYNKAHYSEVEKSLEGTSEALPPAEEYDVSALQDTIEARNLARRRMDASRVTQDSTYAARLRSADRVNLPDVTPEDGDDVELLQKVEKSKAVAEDCRVKYNERALAASKIIGAAAASRIPEGGMPPEADEFTAAPVDTADNAEAPTEEEPPTEDKPAAEDSNLDEL